MIFKNLLLCMCLCHCNHYFMTFNKNIIFCIVVLVILMSLPENKECKLASPSITLKVSIRCQNVSSVVPVKSGLSAAEVVNYLSEALVDLESWDGVDLEEDESSVSSNDSSGSDEQPSSPPE